jgi:hypothetical protein
MAPLGYDTKDRTVNSPFRTNAILWASLFVVLRE